ncbi:MAG: STAS domain-containing protein [Desulfobacteraceae bacterium]|nr:STAS domain-containing protein [Desulfobacteraceae bacterium]
MEFVGVKEPNGFVIRLKGRLDTVAAPQFDEKCGQWLEQGERHVVLDMTGVEYISSVGLRSILILGKKIMALGGKLHISSMSKLVGGVFQISGFSGIFPVFDSVDSALAKF